MTHYRMTPDQYRTKWNLKADYPRVAPYHAEQRSALVKKMGLGRKKTKPSVHPEPAAPKTVRARRKKFRPYRRTEPADTMPLLPN